MRYPVLFIIGVASALLLGALAYSQEEQERIVTAIEVEGNRTVSTSKIISNIKTKVGNLFSEDIATEDIKRLYALGLFSDVNMDLKDYKGGLMVIYSVTEKPLLEKVLFEGNRAIRSKRLKELMKSKEAGLLDPRQLKKDIKKIESLYEKKGYPQAKVIYELKIDPETNQATVYILIDESKKIRIKKVYIEGNKSFKDKRILRLMQTKPDTLFTSGLYRKEVLEEDLQKIKVFYRGEGFIDAQVSSKISYDQRKEKMYITVEINEGKRYFVGKVILRGNVIFPEDEIKKRLQMSPGTVFSQEDLKYDISNVQGYYFEKGYIFAQVEATTSLDLQTGNVDIVYTIAENELAYIDRIEIRGNVRTKDKVIRRQLRVRPGEPFDGEKLKRSRNRLNNLGFFEEVSYDTEPGTQPNSRNLIVEVKEAKTGEFSFGGGYSSIDEFVGFIEIAQRNFDLAGFPTFTGGGQDLRLRAEFGTVREDFELSFTEPWIFDRPVSFGFDAYRRTKDRETDVGYAYNEQRSGGDIRLGREFGEYNRGNLTYRIEEIEISDVPEEATYLKKEEGKATISSLEVRLARDTRDNIFNPTKGMVLGGSIECAGGPFGADKDFLKYIASWSGYLTTFEKFLFELKLRAGIVDAFGDSDEVPTYERFYAGGANTIRGYRERRISPRDPVSNDVIGGESMVVGNIECSFPLFAEFMRGAVFFDTGNVWEEAGDFGSGGFKSGAGVGVRIKTPIGPIKLDYGYPFNKEPGEEGRAGRFHFSMSRGFF